MLFVLLFSFSLFGLLFGAKIRFFLIIALQIQKTILSINTISSIKEESHIFR